jgi:hypothetical protein
MHELRADSALLDRATRRRQLGKRVGRRPHLDLVERIQQPRASHRDPAREGLAAAIAKLQEARAAVDAAEVVLDRKRDEARAAVGVLSNARTAAGRHEPEHKSAYAMRDEWQPSGPVPKVASREDIERAYADWEVRRDLGERVGPRPPSLAQLDAKVRETEQQHADIKAVEARLDVELSKRRQALAMAKASVDRQRALVLSETARELLALHAKFRAAQERVARHLRVLSQAGAIAHQDRHWDALPAREPPDDTGALRAAIDKLEGDPDASLATVIEALKREADR